MKNYKKMSIRNNKGISIIYFTLMTSVFVGLMCLVIDLSQTFTYKARVKSACDLASLAGISQLQSISNTFSAKDSALQFLNTNLSSTIPSFTSLSQGSPDLNLEVGIYDFSTNRFTSDESSSSANALKVQYTYQLMTGLSDYFMISSINISGSAIAAKQPATKAHSGTSFPLLINSSELTNALSNSNMLDLIQTGGSQNSYFSAFDSSANEPDITQILYNFQSGTGSIPPEVVTNNNYRVLNGNPNNIYSNITDTLLEGRSYIFPVVSVSGNSATVLGFVGATLDDIYLSGSDYHVSLTIIPGYIDNSYGGTVIAGNIGSIGTSEQTLLAKGYTLVQ